LEKFNIKHVKKCNLYRQNIFVAQFADCSLLIYLPCPKDNEINFDTVVWCNLIERMFSDAVADTLFG